MRRPAVILALALAASCGRSGFDARRLADTCGLDCAADEVRFRLAAHPRDHRLLVDLAAIEERRGRPGAALAALDDAERLGRPFRGGLGGDDRARLARLLIDRARARVARASPGADADLARARGLGGDAPAELARAAARLAIVADLRHTDPRIRARGRDRLATVEPGWAAALDGGGTAVDRAALAAWLSAGRAGRTAAAWLDDLERARGTAALIDDGLADAWLRWRRWWRGPTGRPDLLTLERAVAGGGGPCWFAGAPGCDVIAAAASDAPGGPPWEPALVDAWQRAGTRAATADEALAWLVVAHRARARGQVGSWSRAVADHTEPAVLAALAGDPSLPGWARPAVARLTGTGVSGAGPRAIAGVPPGAAAVAADDGVGPGRPLGGDAWPAVAVAIAVDRAGTVAVDRAALDRVAVAYADDPALADRRVADLLDRAVDVAEAAPPVATLFALLGDPGRARALWQRAFDADPADERLAFGLALAMSDAGDPAAALLMITRVAAAGGDPARTLYLAARGLAVAGHTVDAIGLARWSIEQSAPGDEAPPAALAAALLRALGRDADAAALADLAPAPRAWDLSDEHVAIAALTVAASDGGDARGRAARERLRALAGDADPARARLAAAALRGVLAARATPPAR